MWDSRSGTRADINRQMLFYHLITLFLFHFSYSLSCRDIKTSLGPNEGQLYSY